MYLAKMEICTRKKLMDDRAGKLLPRILIERTSFSRYAEDRKMV